MAQYQHDTYRPHDLPNSYNAASTTSQAVQNTSGKRRMRRFDTNAVVAMVGGMLLIFMCVGFLCFLWLSNEDNSVWRRIVVTGWLTRSITITSLLLRWTVAAQAAVMTSMVAALLLQTSETPLSKAAAVSLAVFSNTGPHGLLGRLPRALGRRSCLFWLIVLLMTWTTTLLQFTSTALLSDVGIGVITDRRRLSLPYGINSTAQSQANSQVESRGYLATRPRSYPAFAEYTEPVLPRDGVTDTGLSMRAFLPIDPQSSRELAIGYSGAATLLDTRVACMRPAFSKIKIQAFLFDSWIAGSVWTKETVPRLNTSTGMNGRVQHSPFNCSFSVPSSLGSSLDIAASEWPITICNIPFADEFGNRDTGLVSEMLPIPPEPYTQPFPGPMYLVINTTGTFDHWGLVNNAGGDLKIKKTVTDKTEWTTLETDASGLSFGMTLCSFSLEVQDTNITATRPHGAAEAAASWIASLSMYDTRAIQEQLGGTNPILPRVERGIFELAKKASWLEPPSMIVINDSYAESSPAPPADFSQIMLTAFNDLPGGGGHSIDLFGTANNSSDVLEACEFCGMTMSRLHAAVFQGVIKDTGSAAWAIQALVTSLFSMSYYDHFFQFDVPAPIDMETELAVTRPTSWRFFGAVLATVALHLVLMAFATMWFLRRVEDGLLGGSWAAVARVSGPATDGWLAVASTATDAEISEGLEKAGQKNVLVGSVRFGDQVRLRQRI
ncbi:hypothetical protein FSOLCH5_007722 [Fusarium solani]|nr:hypothetical protein NW759_015168 [Fusarium solani]